MQPARGGKKKQSNHNDKYWERLREQFQTCRYDHSGAYCQIGNGKNKEIAAMAADINTVEETLQDTAAFFRRKVS